MNNEDQIALLTKAIHSLEWAKGYIEEACEGFDPSARGIANIIKQIRDDIDSLEGK